MKRIISILLSAIMLAAISVPVFAVEIEANICTVLKIGSGDFIYTEPGSDASSSVTIEDVLTADVSIDCEYAAYAKVILTYDSSSLEYAGYSTDLFETAVCNEPTLPEGTPGRIVFAFAGSSAINEIGTFIRVAFKCNTSTVPGETVTVNCEVAELMDIDYNDISFSISNGTYTFPVLTHTVTFIDGLNNSVISTSTVEDGNDAVFPEAPEHEGYTFTGWDSDGKNITEDTTITAIYQEDAANILITKVDIDNVPDVLYSGMRVGDCLDFTFNDSNYTVESLVWLAAPATMLFADDEFTAGQSYYLVATFIPNDGYYFSDDTVATINGSADNVRAYMATSYGQFIVSSHYYVCEEGQNDKIPISAVRINDAETTPKAGEVCGEHISCTIPEDANYSIVNSFWYNVTDSEQLKSDDVFENGKQYSVVFCIEAAEGYCFDINTVLMLNNSAELYILSGIDENGTAWIYSIPETAEAEVSVLIGDLNGDSKVNTADAVVVLKYAASMITLDETQHMAGDCNRDEKVNTADAVLILKYAAGMIQEF